MRDCLPISPKYEFLRRKPSNVGYVRLVRYFVRFLLAKCYTEHESYRDTSQPLVIFQSLLENELLRRCWYFMSGVSGVANPLAKITLTIHRNPCNAIYFIACPNWTVFYVSMSKKRKSGKACSSNIRPFSLTTHSRLDVCWQHEQYCHRIPQFYWCNISAK